MCRRKNDEALGMVIRPKDVPLVNEGNGDDGWGD